MSATSLEEAAVSESELLHKVARDYGADAAAYRQLWAPVLNRMTAELVGALPAADRVVDLATGVGTLLPHLRGRLVLGLDAAPDMLALADPTFGRILGDVTKLPFGMSTLDAAVLAFVLFHLPRPGDALVEGRRVLRDGGTIGTATWASSPSTPAYEAFTQELDRHGARPETVQAWHHLVDGPAKVTALLEGAGFREARAWTRDWRDEVSAEEFVRRRVRLGVTRRRLESLSPEARGACVAAATERIGRMELREIQAEWRVVLATARA